MRRRRWHIVAVMPGRVARLSGLSQAVEAPAQARTSNLRRYLKRVCRKLAVGPPRTSLLVGNFAAVKMSYAGLPPLERQQEAPSNLRQLPNRQHDRALVAGAPRTRIIVKFG
jgi:hypothetical protein